MRTIYISIGNSDDRLTQKQWAEFVAEMLAEVKRSASDIHGAWFSGSASPWQNACWCVVFGSEAVELGAKDQVAEIGRRFGQEAISWAVAETEFI